MKLTIKNMTFMFLITCFSMQASETGRHRSLSAPATLLSMIRQEQSSVENTAGYVPTSLDDKAEGALQAPVESSAQFAGLIVSSDLYPEQ